MDKNEYASETCNMLRDQGLENEVFPIQADAAALPLPHGAFDALVCVNAYHNFGMEAGFFEEKLRPLLREGAEVGFVLLGRDEDCARGDDGNQNPVFWYADEWKRWFESEGIDVRLCEQLKCTERAWKEWMTIYSPSMSEEELARVKFNPELALIKLVGRV